MRWALARSVDLSNAAAVFPVWGLVEHWLGVLGKTVQILALTAARETGTLHFSPSVWVRSEERSTLVRKYGYREKSIILFRLDENRIEQD